MNLKLCSGFQTNYTHLATDMITMIAARPFNRFGIAALKKVHVSNSLKTSTFNCDKLYAKTSSTITKPITKCNVIQMPAWDKYDRVAPSFSSAPLIMKINVCYEHATQPLDRQMHRQSDIRAKVTDNDCNIALQ